MKTFLTLLSSLGIAASSSFAATILTSDGNGADSYIRQGQLTNNFGATTNILLKGGNGSTTRKGYLRFDLSSITGPITDASITLTVSTNNSGGGTPLSGQTFNVDFFGLTNESLDNWVEGNDGTDNSPLNEITYTNAPGNLNPGNDFNGDALFLGTLNVPGTLAGESITFTDPNLVAFLNNDTNNLAGILMRRQLGGSSNLAFSSREGANTPQLDVTTIPEPSAFAMVLLAAGAGLLRRKR
ncbi:DNRLRE domain-containing protein [bacterium]|nr:DNRLRE domain-containing protein [Akkermansiaceae bacterium]MDB4792538.1 DNRLRE domain-containing protein [bacterium]